jgi:hypothetical protein
VNKAILARGANFLRLYVTSSRTPRYSETNCYRGNLSCCDKEEVVVGDMRGIDFVVAVAALAV